MTLSLCGSVKEFCYGRMNRKPLLQRYEINFSTCLADTAILIGWCLTTDAWLAKAIATLLVVYPSTCFLSRLLMHLRSLQRCCITLRCACCCACMSTPSVKLNRNGMSSKERLSVKYMHGAVRKRGKYINTCLAFYICSDIPKYAWGFDSMIAIFRLPKLTLSEMKVRFLCAKTQRFMGWAYTLDTQEISGTRMSEIHSVLHSNPDQFNSATVNIIMQWDNRTVLPQMIADASAESGGDDDHRVLYTPAAATCDVAMEDT